jgi:hypothetical protein
LRQNSFEAKEDESDLFLLALEVQEEEALIIVEGKEWVCEKSVIIES